MGDGGEQRLKYTSYQQACGSVHVFQNLFMVMHPFLNMSYASVLYVIGDALL